MNPLDKVIKDFVADTNNVWIGFRVIGGTRHQVVYFTDGFHVGIT